VAKPFVDAVGGPGRHPAGLLAGILLVALGCDLGPGYLLSRPLDAAAAGELLVASV
jgi:hypothetical protein